MISSINNQYHHLKPYYKHAPITLFLYITLILLLVSPLSVTAQYGGHHSSRGGPSPLYMGIVLAVATVFVAIMFIILNLFCKIAVGRRAEDSPAQQASKGLDPSVLESFPVFKYSEVAAHRAHSGPLECAVCLSPFEPDEKLRLLPKCNHVFHVECLDPWLKGHSTCPLCRIDLVPETSEVSRVGSGRAHESGGEVNEGGNDVNDYEVVRGDVEEGHIVKYKRWKSTGHVAEVGGMEQECWTKFTLMLPEKEMKKFGEVTVKFKRTRSSL